MNKNKNIGSDATVGYRWIVIVQEKDLESQMKIIIETKAWLVEIIKSE